MNIFITIGSLMQQTRRTNAACKVGSLKILFSFCRQYHVSACQRVIINTELQIKELKKIVTFATTFSSVFPNKKLTARDAFVFTRILDFFITLGLS